MWSWSQEHALGSSSLTTWNLQGAHLRVLASMRYHMYDEEDRADLDQGLGWITFLAKGEKRMVTFRQLEILFGSKAAQIRSPVLRYVHKALANTFFARKAPGQSTRGNSSFLTWESSPSLTHKRWQEDQGDRHTGNLMPSLSSSTYKITAYNTLSTRGRKLSVGGLITPILCAAGVNPTDREPLNQVGWTSSFARPTFSLSTRSWMGGSNSSSHIHWLDPPSFSCPNPELTTVVRGENIDFRPPVYTLVGHEEFARRGA
ncbi:unnamed protein product [Microthlaspi erraticum]|uniref:Arabidopsis retrotransposon Orf1 C-terminal domain-containing protein n=1 Tax=Microthlaspi erraticum TaxID=1685480 RepID=A0A6D2JMH8_9BRAS|nr:unnamed protein product [Microthlaspi erraticum]